MQVKETVSEGLKREYDVTIEAKQLDKTIDDKLQSLGATLKLPGFRPGKIPKQVLKQRYGDKARAEAVEAAVNEATRDLMKEKDIRPATSPKIDVKSAEEGKDMKFTMSLEIFPDVPKTDFSKVTLDRYTFDVSDEDVAEGLKRLAEGSKTAVKITGDRKAKEGDQLLIDFLGKKDGTPFEGGEGKDFEIVLGSNTFIPGFEDQLLGHKQGEEFTITVTFPKEYHSADLAGADATFDIVLHEIREMKEPEINEEFAKEYKFDSLDDLKSKVKEQLEKDYNQLVRAKLKKALFDKLDDTVEFTLPETMLKQEFDSIWGRIEEAKDAGEDVFEGRAEKDVKAEYEELAKRRVKLGLYLAEVSTREKLTVGQDELRQAVMQQAQQYPGQEMKVLEFYQKNPQASQELAGPLLEEKSVDFILDKVKYKDTKITLPELLEMEKQEAEEDSSKAKKGSAKKSSTKKPASGKGKDSKGKEEAA